MNTASILEQFEAQHGPAGAVQAPQWRREALAAFSARGFPTRRDEQWRYTDLKPLQQEPFDLAPQRPSTAIRGSAEALLAANALDLGGPRLVFIDGHFDAELSDATEQLGLRVSPLVDSPDSLALGTGNAGARVADDAAHPLAALNAAFARQGALIDVVPGALPTPLQLVFIGGGRERAAPQPRIVIELAPQASAVIVQRFLDAADAAPAWLNLVTDVRLSASSSLTFYRLQTHGPRQLHTSLLRARLARDARLRAGYVERGGRLVRNDVDVALAEPGAHAALFGLTFADGEQHIDNQVRVDHRAPRTTSIETFRAIAGDRAHAVFGGKVIVRPDAQRIDARQNSDNLLLSDKAEIDTKPELEIYADDVKCSHGATVGELDETQLFYLRSRGIPAAQAHAVLTFAFAQAVLEHIELEPLRAAASHLVAGRLPDGADSEARA